MSIQCELCHQTFESAQKLSDHNYIGRFVDHWQVNDDQFKRVLNLSGYLFEQSIAMRGAEFGCLQSQRRSDADTMSYSILYDGMGIVR